MIKIDVLNEKENRFFKRKDLELSLDHNTVGTPSKTELVEKIAEMRGVDKTQVIVDYIDTKKGATKSTAKVKVLDEKPPVEEKAEEKKEGEAAPADALKEEAKK